MAVVALAAGIVGCSVPNATEPPSSPPATPLATTSATLGQVPGQDCTGAAEKYNNKHNICASWDGTQAAPFVSVGQVGTSTSVFSSTEFDAGGTEDHHVTAQPGSFGASTWGATSADENYGASMNWTFAVSEPSDTVTGNATQTGDSNGSQSCNNGTYIACSATGQMGQVGGSSNPTNPENRVSYLLANAPMVVDVINNTGATMTEQGSPVLNYVQSSSAGTTGNTACIAPLSPSGTPAPCPSVSGPSPIRSGTATSAFYRQLSGNTAEYKVVYSFPDVNNPQVTHNVTIDVQASPANSTGNPAEEWTTTTSNTTCTDNPTGPVSNPNQATCNLVWSGNSQWLALLTLQATVNAAP